MDLALMDRLGVEVLIDCRGDANPAKRSRARTATGRPPPGTPERITYRQLVVNRLLNVGLRGQGDVENLLRATLAPVLKIMANKITAVCCINAAHRPLVPNTCVEVFVPFWGLV